MNRLLMAQGPLDRLSMLGHGILNILWVVGGLILALVVLVLVCGGLMAAWEWMTNHPFEMIVVAIIGLLVALVGWIVVGGSLPVVAGLLLIGLAGFALAGSFGS